MNVMNSFVKDLFDQIALETSKLVRNQKVHTLTALLPGDLAKHVIIEGNKAVNKIAQA